MASAGDPFSDRVLIGRVYRRLAEVHGKEIPPEQLESYVRTFFLTVQDKLAVAGLWLTAEELLDRCHHPSFKGLVDAYAAVRGKNAPGVAEVVDAVLLLETHILSKSRKGNHGAR